MKREKGEMRIIEMPMVLDDQGKVRVPQDLMDALSIAPGDMLSFYFGDEGVTVEGGKKPPYFHADTIAPARGYLKQRDENTSTAKPVPVLPTTEVKATTKSSTEFT
jgi:hypothetical protein